MIELLRPAPQPPQSPSLVVHNFLVQFFLLLCGSGVFTLPPLCDPTTKKHFFCLSSLICLTFQAIQTCLVDRTLLTITHRVNTVLSCVRLAVLKGELVD